jgi:arabinofuranosyltransferase
MRLSNFRADAGRSERLIDLITLISAFVLASIAAQALLPSLVDDSFIYLRVAANIAHGTGWVYNPGETSNPATSVLYTLLLVATGSVIGFGEQTLAVAYTVSLCALFTVQYLAWRKSDGWPAAVTIAIGCCFSSCLLGAFGMESPLLLALVSASALSWRRFGDGYRTGLLLGLTALTRPEGIAMLGLVGLLGLARRRIAWRSTLVAVLLMLPWILFATVYFGTAMSQTAAVKAAQRHYGWWATQPDFVIGFLSQPLLPWLTFSVAAIGMVLAWQRARKGDAFALLCIGFGLLQTLGYQLLGAPLGYAWYFACGNFAVDLAILLAGISLIRWLSERIRANAGKTFASAAGCLLLLALMSRFAVAPASMPGAYGLSRQYRVGADWLRTHSDKDDTFAATEIGYLGWYSGLRVLDTHGLIHPDALSELRKGNLHWWYDRGQRPRFVVNHIPAWHGEPGNETWPAELSKDFLSGYHVVFEFDVVRIYERNPGSS